MSEVRPIDANELKDSIVENIRELGDQCSPVMLTMFGLFSDIIENAPTIDTTEKYNDGYEKGYKHGYKDGQNSGRPQGEFTDLEREVIADSINYLLSAEVLGENGYTEEVIAALKSVLSKIGAE